MKTDTGRQRRFPTSITVTSISSCQCGDDVLVVSSYYLWQRPLLAKRPVNKTFGEKIEVEIEPSFLEF